MAESWTSLKLIQWTADYFQKARIPNPRLDAELLLAHVLKCQRIDLYTRHEALLSEKHLSAFKALIQRRVKREPLQYIVGETEFYGLTFKVSPEVLIPRPETELLVEEALKAGTRVQGVGSREDQKPYTLHPTPCILDIGTGSGCIAIVLAKQLPTAKIIATDISEAALEIAHDNAKRHEVADRVEFILSDIAPWKRFTAEGRQFDLIVSNPPYIAAGEFEALQPEVRDFEPRRALEGGPDGLAVIRQIIAEAPPFLKPGGRILMEIGDDQGKPVEEIVRQQPALVFQGIRKDLSGVARIAILCCAS